MCTFVAMVKKLLKGFLKIVGVLLLVLVVVYFCGPTPETPVLTYDLPEVPADLQALAAMIQEKESADSIKPGNEAEIFWANDTAPQKTRYSLLYLHGFSASKEEGAPIHREFAKRYGCNAYLARLADHGIDSENALLGYTPGKAVNSAKEAFAIAQQLGDSVIIMSCSTGGSLAIYLAGGPYPVKGLINYSPNIAMARGDSYFLNKPWGLQIANFMFDTTHYCWSYDPESSKYWQTCYRLEALPQLQELLEATMTDEQFASVKQPFFMGYYFKSDSAQDEVVSVPAMLEMYGKLGTPEHLKRSIAFPEAGAHVICSPMKANSWEKVREETFRFAEEVLQLEASDK